MIKDRFKTQVSDDHPYLGKEYQYPLFKKGDVVWVINEETSLYREFSLGKYQSNKCVVMNGEPIDDDTGLHYRVVGLDNFNSDHSDERLSDFEYIVAQTDMFKRLSQLKKAIDYKCRERIKRLEINIKSIEAQNLYIQEQIDEQEHREEQINSVIDA